MAFNLPKGKPKNGNLIQVLPSGKITTLVSNRPFAELQITKKKYTQRGYSESTLKVTNLNPKQA